MFFKNYNLVNFTNKDFSFNDLNLNEVEIPYGNHPGAFGFKRKNHIHEGIDLYCKENDIVLSLTDGKVIDIGFFTGDEVKSPWWNTTQYIAIEYKDYVIIYGEIIVDKNLSIGSCISINQELGFVTPVLKKVKNNRPTNMLHLELYDKEFYTEPKEWIDNKPDGLLDPFLLIDNLFNMDYPSKKDYEFLYKKYIETEFKFDNYKLLDYSNKDVLDLCGGAGYVSKNMLLKNVKSIDYFDLSKIMIDEEIMNNSNINKYFGNVENQLPDKKYDFIITKQAINYWFNNIDINYLSNHVNKNGYLVFNTFFVPENKTKIYKKYIIDNIEYEEYSFLKDEKIYHIQKCGEMSHKTIFNNIKEDDFINKIINFFHQIDIYYDKNSIYYFCKKI